MNTVEIYNLLGSMSLNDQAKLLTALLIKDHNEQFIAVFAQRAIENDISIVADCLSDGEPIPAAVEAVKARSQDAVRDMFGHFQTNVIKQIETTTFSVALTFSGKNNVAGVPIYGQ